MCIHDDHTSALTFTIGIDNHLWQRRLEHNMDVVIYFDVAVELGEI